MKIWKNTATLDAYLDKALFTENKNEAYITLIGAKGITVSEFPNLKGIFRAGVSKDNIPFEEAAAKNIIVRFPSAATIDFIYEETANFTCQTILRMLYNNVGTIEPWVKSDRVSLQEKTLLVIGTGNIGKRVAEKMKSFMQVITYDTMTNSPDELRLMISSSDCITLHIPSNAGTKDFIDKEKLSWMKEGSVLVNTARGAIVSEEALYDVIRAGRIRAGFDVYWQEPYSGKLKEFHPDRFFMTPHVASTCSAFLKGSADDLLNFMKELV